MPPKFRAKALPDVGGHREQKKKNTGRLPLKFCAKALPEVWGHRERDVSGRMVHRQTDGLQSSRAAAESVFVLLYQPFVVQ